MKFNEHAESLYCRQDYGLRPPIEGVTLLELRRFNDDAGSMTELCRLSGGRIADLPGFTAAQVSYSVLHPGATKAYHLHKKQTDVWFVPPEDRMLLVLGDVRAGSATEGRTLRLVLGDGNSRLVRIPPGVAHGCRNLAAVPGRVFYFTDLQFSPEPEETDEGRLPWDFLGAEVWDLSRE